MSLRESYKEHYVLESTRRTELMGALAVPVAILTVVLGALAIIAKELHVPLDGKAITQLVLVFLGCSASAVCTYFIFRSLYGLAYAYVPTPKELAKYGEDLIAFYIASGKSATEAAVAAENDVLEHLYTEYAKNASRNANNNDIKAGHLHNANSMLVAAVVFTALAGVAFVVSSVVSPTSPSKVEVINMPGTSPSSPIHLQAATAPPPPPPAPPVRPTAPPSRVVREHKIPPPPPSPPRR
jgi:hypothetical protein